MNGTTRLVDTLFRQLDEAARRGDRVAVINITARLVSGPAARRAIERIAWAGAAR